MSFLTVLPVANTDGGVGERLGRAYFPAIGALIGLVAGLAFVLTAAMSTPLVGGAVAVAVLCLLTGAIHLDGLADTADGLLTSAGDVEKRLAIMRDPRLGSYGVSAIVVVLILDVAAVTSLAPGRAIAALVIAGAFSRLATLAVIAFVPYVRAAGLGIAAWEQRRRGLDLTIGAASAAVVALLDWRRALVAVPVVALTALVVVVLARRRIGGATGDICGATAELTQMAALLVFAVQ